MRKTTSGFTIIEVLVVVAIIGVLTTVGFVSYGSIEAGARDSKRSSQITVISEALEKYYDQTENTLAVGLWLTYLRQLPVQH